MTGADAIRAAIAAIADEAEPQRVQAGLDARLRRHRQRRLLLRTAGVTAAAAVGGLTTYRLMLPGEENVFPEVAGGPGGGWLRAPLRWRPGWLPDGLGLVMLGAVVDGETATVVGRTWRFPDGSRRVVSVTTGWDPAYAPSVEPAKTETVDVNGVRATLSSYLDDATVLVTSGEPRLSVTAALDDAARERDVVLRVARSLRPDPGTFAVGPRPAARTWMYSLFAEGGSWVQNMAMGDVTVSAGPAVTGGAAAHRPVTVRGVPASLSQDGTQLFAEGLDGRNVLVAGQPGGPDLVALLAGLELGPEPDMSWYGTR